MWLARCARRPLPSAMRWVVADWGDSEFVGFTFVTLVRFPLVRVPGLPGPVATASTKWYQAVLEEGGGWGRRVYGAHMPLLTSPLLAMTGILPGWTGYVSSSTELSN